MIGQAAANALVPMRAANEIVLVDAQPERAAAKAKDVSHATPWRRLGGLPAALLNPGPDVAGRAGTLRSSVIL